MIVRQTLSLFIIIAELILLCIASTAHAQTALASSAEKSPISFTPGERAWLASHPVITLATYREGAPYGFVDEQGGYIGVIPDLTARIEKLLGIQIQFKPVEYSVLLDSVKSGSADMTTLNDPSDMPYNEHYLKTQEFLFLPYALFVRKDSDLAAHPSQAMNGRTIALVKGWDLSNPTLEVLRGCTFVFADSMLDCINLVLNGKADGFYDVLSGINYLLWKNSIQDLKIFKVYNEGYPVAFFVRREWPELKSALQKALEAISREERAQLLIKWNAFMDDFSYRLKMVDLGPEERQWLKDHPVIRVGIDSQWAPVEFADDAGQGKGLTIEYLKEIEKMLGIRFDISSGTAWEALLESTKNGALDMLSCIAETPERSRFLTFTRPYISLPVVVLTGKDAAYISDLHELDGRKVGVVQGYAVQEWMARDFPAIELVPAASTGDMLSLLAQGRVQACVESLLVAGYYIGKIGYGNIKVAGQTPYTYQMGMAVRSDYRVLAGILQKALDIIPAEQRNAAQQKWMTVAYERVFDYSLLWKVLLPLLLALAIFAYWTRRLSREVSSRKRAETLLREAQKNLEQMNLDLDARVRQRTLDLEQATHTLRESEERFRAIAENSPDAIIITGSSSVMMYVNSAAERMFGYTQEELLGKPASILLPPRLQAKEAMQRGEYERTGESDFIGSTIESLAACKDGTELPIEFSVFGWEIEGDSFFATITRDITERKQSENEVHQARDYIENIFKASPDSILVVDPDGYILMANDSVYSVYGYRPEEIVGQHVSILSVQDEKVVQKTFALIEELYEAGFVKNYACERRRKDGSIILIEVSIVLLKNPDGKISAISSGRDITDRKRLEEQLRQSQKMEAIGTLAGGIAHDFNNILGVIFGYAELSQALTAGNSVLDKNLTQILKAAERATGLVRQILAFSRKRETEVKPLHTHLIIKECLKLLRASLPSTIEISTDLDEADDIVMADPTEIHQIIMNLCTNAAHAMQQTGGSLEIQLKALDIDEHGALSYSSIEPGPYVHLNVTDTGIGISADIIDRVFEPFFTTKDVGSGTGMGLAVVHGIVKGLRGDIKVYSEPCRGSVFHVVLPRVREAKVEDGVGVQAAPRGHEAVLLVDDEVALLNVGTQLLGALGYHVTALQSPLEALELFKQEPAAFDIVISDQTMPQLTGYELAKRLMQVRPDIPIVLCTGYSALVTAESALAVGIKAFIIKPLNRLTVAKTIRSVLDNKEAAPIVLR